MVGRLKENWESHFEHCHWPLAIEDINNDNTEKDSSFHKKEFGLEGDVVAETDEN